MALRSFAVNRSWLLLVAAVLVMAGCAAPTEAPPERPDGLADDERVASGMVIEYRSKATVADVTIHETITIRDFAGNDHQAMPIKIELTERGTPRGSVTSFVDPATGRTMAVIRPCVFVQTCIAYEWIVEGQGIPAPLGLGWNATQELNAITYKQGGQGREITVSAEGAGECVIRELTRPPHSIGWVPAIAMPPGRIVHCGTSTVPASFTLLGETFQFVSARPSDGQPLEPWTFDAHEPTNYVVSSGLSPVKRTGSIYTESASTPDHLPLQLALQEAPRVSRAVANFMETYPAYVVASTSSEGEGGAGVQGAENSIANVTVRRIELAAPDQNGLQFMVKRERLPGGLQRFTVTDETQSPSAHAPLPLVANEVDLAQAIEASTRLTVAEFFGSHANLRQWLPGQEPTTLPFDDHYEYAVRMKGPNVQTGFSLLLEARMDASTGDWTRLFLDDVSNFVDPTWYQPFT